MLAIASNIIPLPYADLKSYYDLHFTQSSIYKHDSQVMDLYRQPNELTSQSFRRLYIKKLATLIDII